MESAVNLDLNLDLNLDFKLGDKRSGKQTFLCIGATMDKTGGMEAVIRKRVDLARSAFSPRKMCMEDSGSQHNIAVCTMTI